jgi:hypothetical protein
MKRFALSALFVSLLAMSWLLFSDAPTTAAQSTPSSATSGRGKMKFRVLYTSSHLPAEAQKVLTKAHGGFAVDRRPGKGEIYFALPGAGIIQISADLKSTRMVATPPEMKDTNLHNTAIWYAPDGAAFLSFPGNEANAVFTTSLDGKLLNTLKTPDGKSDLGSPIANDYFNGRGNFVPTDVAQLDGTLYMTTGYSNLDFVLTARIEATSPLKTAWHDLAFGGRGTGIGQLGTGHGVTVPPGTRRIDVADRPNSEIDRYTRHGQYLSTLKMPLGSFPCDIDYEGPYAVVGSLHGPDRGKGAPIYILENDELISTIMPKQDLGMANFQHVHNAVIHQIGNKVYVIAQAWNPGDFAIFEQVPD